MTTEQALSDILWYNGYCTFDGKNSAEMYEDDAKIDKFCFVNVLLDFAKKWDWSQNVSSKDLDAYIEHLRNKYNVEIMEHKLNDWGTSIRSGWLENKKGIISWCMDEIKKLNKNFDYIPIEH